MTTSVAPVANLTPPANSPSNDPTGPNPNDPNSDFSKPLQRAHQQLARQSEPTRPAHGKHAAAKTASSGQQPAKGAHEHKDDGTAAAVAPDATAAMLALLGQSVPASAAASSVADGDDAADTSAAAGTTIASSAASTSPANIALLGAAQAVTPATQATGTDDFAKAMDGVKDKSLSMLGQDADDGDATVDASSADAAPAIKSDAFATALQALGTSSNQNDHSDTLEALKNLSAQAMPQQPQTPSSVATAPAPHALTMQSNVGSPAFGQELSQQVTWLGGQDVKEARIRLHPEDMGELDVKVSVKQDHVDVAFIAQHPQAVHAVQQTLSQLDSMLAHHGLSLGQAMVGQGNTGQGSAQPGSSHGSSGGESALAEGVGELASIAAPVIKAVGLVDMFA